MKCSHYPETELSKHQSGLGLRIGSTMKNGNSALEQAARLLVAKLNSYLMTELGIKLLDMSHDLNVVMPAVLHRGGHPFLFVSMYPIDWPLGSQIRARFYWKDRARELYDSCEIRAPHLTPPIVTLRFEPIEGGMGIALRSEDESQLRFIADARDRLIESLALEASPQET